MNAREKINQMSMIGAFIGAAFLGIIFGSWIIFFVALVAIAKSLAANGLLRFDSNGSRVHRRIHR